MTRDKEGREACPSAPLPAGAIERYVVERLPEATAGAGLAEDVAASVEARVEAKRTGLETARRELPAKIAALSAEGKRLIETVRDIDESARRLVDERLKEVGLQLGRAEASLADAERELSNLDAIEVEAGWVTRCLAEFAAVWDLLTPENRARLVRAIVERVEVEERANRITVVLATIGVGEETASSKPDEKEAA